MSSSRTHSPTTATGTAWNRTPWHATQRAAREALRKTECRVATMMHNPDPHRQDARLIAKILNGRTLAAAIVMVLSVAAVHAEPFRTKDPLRAFVREEYPLGNDYFVRGNEDTYLFRCVLSRGPNLFDGIALSEISIWGRTGPWEIFRREPAGDFVYLETGELPSTSCLEFCRSKEYLETGRCNWQRGWPK